MAVTWITRLAAQAPVPVFIARGTNAAAFPALDADIRVVDSPRAASLLLVAGQIPPALTGYLDRLHDQLPHPRATVFWGARPTGALAQSPFVGEGGDLAAVLIATHAALVTGRRSSEPDLLPDRPPHPWRGIGPHGQGGKGMMGGTPYGRPMAMTDADLRDGLALDSYTADFGPFLPMFPAGLVLTLTLQGDVIQKVVVSHPPLPGSDCRLSNILHLLGLPALALRLRRVGPRRSMLSKLVRLSGARAAIPVGLGRVPDGSDVRSRFDAMIAGATEMPASQAGLASLGDLLVGLEWHQAMLVLNSLDGATLQDLCATAQPGRPDEDAETPSGHHHPQTGHGP